MEYEELVYEKSAEVMSPCALHFGSAFEFPVRYSRSARPAVDGWISQLSYGSSRQN